MNWFFPREIYKLFRIKDWQSNEDSVTIAFEEKDIPPLDDSNRDKKVIARQFHDITVSDFPL